MPGWNFYRHSGIPASMHVHNACPCPCCMSMSMLHVGVNVHVHIYRNAGMPEQVLYRTKLTQSNIFLVRYRTKIWDAGMSMSVLVSSMPMPSYDWRYSSPPLHPSHWGLVDIRENICTKKPGSPPPYLIGFMRSECGSCAHNYPSAILPPPFSWGGENLYFTKIFLLIIADIFSAKLNIYIFFI